MPMMTAYLLFAVLIAGLMALARSHAQVRALGYAFYAVQLIFAASVWLWARDTEQLQFFTFDTLGSLFLGLLSVISLVAFCQSNVYLKDETLHPFKTYHISLALLCTSATAVYFSNNLAVTWVFLEATTLATAGLIYHGRSESSLEATWKYVFICSTGILLAYLGVLLLSTVATQGDLSYASLAGVIATGNPLYLKIAFLFILVGYSCKLEVFPLYTVGIDANYAAPTPASAVISTVLVNAGFVSLMRVYRLFALTPVYSWVSGVLVLCGVISVLVGAVYLRRTNHYKRFFAYSTTENLGIVLIGLGLGGVAVFAAIFHVMAHSLVKSGIFFNVAQIGKIYGSYRINRIGNYVSVNRLGSVSMLLGTVSLLALPPSALFISELMIFKQVIVSGQWWLFGVMVILLCFVMYSLSYRLLRLLYKPVHMPADGYSVNRWVTWSGFVLILSALVLGVTQPDWLVEFIESMLAG